ncbi:MAG: hypothetical protein HC817_08075, partial [Saprospiraceae bacterium]|nr:hypothetical protein [Saprospiraceae bacterium]
PSATSTISSFGIGLTTTQDNFGNRVRGWIRPTETGNYTFTVTGDDGTELWLSTNETAASRVRIAYFNGWTNVNEFTKYSTQGSTTIALIAGQNYYVELLNKEGGGGEFFQVHWTTPSNSTRTIVPGANLVAFTNLNTCSERKSVVQWSYTEGVCTLSDNINIFNDLPVTANAGVDTSVCNQTQITLNATTPSVGTGIWTVVSGPGTVTNPTSRNSTVTNLVAGQNTVLRWTVTNGACTVFDDLTLTNNILPIANAGNDTILCAATTYTLPNIMPSLGTGVWTKLSGTGTLSGNVLDLTQNVCSPETQSTGSLLFERYDAIGGSAVSNLTSAAAYPNSPSSSTFINQFTFTSSPNQENYGSRVTGYIRPSESGSYTFIVTGDDNVELWLEHNK